MKEASKILGVSVRRLQILDREGEIECVRIIGGRGRIPGSELERILGIREEPIKLAQYLREEREVYKPIEVFI